MIVHRSWGHARRRRTPIVYTLRDRERSCSVLDMDTDQTITVRGRTYRVVMEPDFSGQIQPYLYNSRGQVCGLVHTFSEAAARNSGRPVWILGTPVSWTNADIRSALDQLGL